MTIHIGIVSQKGGVGKNRVTLPYDGKDALRYPPLTSDRVLRR